jgi:sortase A
MDVTAAVWGRRRRRLPLLPLVLIVAGVVLLVSFAADIFAGQMQQRQLIQSWQHTLVVTHPPRVPADPTVTPGAVDGVDFAIRVPKIGYYAAVQEGVESNNLASGPGHYPTTPWPGQIGNVGVAAHNTYWIAFGDLKPGDEIDLETRYGTYRYAVTGSRIVWPNDRTALVRTPDKELTLTTCWPLWAGAFATQRLIISARQVFPSPPPASTS